MVVDQGLTLLLFHADLRGRAHDFHAQRGLVDESVQRQQLQAGSELRTMCS